MHQYIDSVYLLMPSRFIAQILELLVNHYSYSFTALLERSTLDFCDDPRYL